MASFCPLAVPGGSQGGGAIQVHRSMQIAPSPLGPSPVVAINLSASTSSKTDEACECATSPAPKLKRLWEFEEAPRREVLEEDEERMWRRTFAVGDCADAFGAIKAGHTGWNQAEVAAKNVLRMIRWEERGGTVEEMEPSEKGEDVPAEGYKLERYEPNLPMMKLTLGLVSCPSPR